MIRTAVLLPVLIWQALGVRRRALQLPEASGPRAGTTGTGPNLSLLMIGDSSAAGVGAVTQNEALAGQIVKNLSQDFSLSWTLRARTGATTRSTFDALMADPPDPADVVVLVLGVNDVTRLVPKARWLRQQTKLCEVLQARVRPRAIYLTGLPPMGRFPLLPHPLRGVLGARADAMDAARRAALPEKAGLYHTALPGPFDAALMAEDGFHPGPSAYAMWGKQMASRIISDWPFEKS